MINNLKQQLRWYRFGSMEGEKVLTEPDGQNPRSNDFSAKQEKQRAKPIGYSTPHDEYTQTVEINDLKGQSELKQDPSYISTRMLGFIDKSTGTGNEKNMTVVAMVKNVSIDQVNSVTTANEKLIAYYNSQNGNVIYAKQELKDTQKIPEGYVLTEKSKEKLQARSENPEKSFAQKALSGIKNTPKKVFHYVSSNNGFEEKRFVLVRKIARDLNRGVIAVSDAEKSILKLSLSSMPILNVAARTQRVFNQYGYYEGVGIKWYWDSFLGTNFVWDKTVLKVEDLETGLPVLQEVDISNERLKNLRLELEDASAEKKEAINNQINQIVNIRLSAGRQAKNFVKDAYGGGEKQTLRQYANSIRNSFSKEIVVDAVYNSVRATLMSILGVSGIAGLNQSTIVASRLFNSASTPIYTALNLAMSKDRKRYKDKVQGAFIEAGIMSVMNLIIPEIISQRITMGVSDISATNTGVMMLTPSTRFLARMCTSLGFAGLDQLRLQRRLYKASSVEERSNIQAETMDRIMIRSGFSAMFGFALYNSDFGTALKTVSERIGLTENVQDFRLKVEARRQGISVHELEEKLFLQSQAQKSGMSFEEVEKIYKNNKPQVNGNATDTIRHETLFTNDESDSNITNRILENAQNLNLPANMPLEDQVLFLTTLDLLRNNPSLKENFALVYSIDINQADSFARGNPNQVINFARSLDINPADEGVNENLIVQALNNGVSTNQQTGVDVKSLISDVVSLSPTYKGYELGYELGNKIREHFEDGKLLDDTVSAIENAVDGVKHAFDFGLGIVGNLGQSNNETTPPVIGEYSVVIGSENRTLVEGVSDMLSKMRKNGDTDSYNKLVDHYFEEFKENDILVNEFKNRELLPSNFDPNTATSDFIKNNPGTASLMISRVMIAQNPEDLQYVYNGEVLNFAENGEIIITANEGSQASRLTSFPNEVTSSTMSTSSGTTTSESTVPSSDTTSTGATTPASGSSSTGGTTTGGLPAPVGSGNPIFEESAITNNFEVYVGENGYNKTLNATVDSLLDEVKGSSSTETEIQVYEHYLRVLEDNPELETNVLNSMAGAIPPSVIGNLNAEYLQTNPAIASLLIARIIEEQGGERTEYVHNGLILKINPVSGEIIFGVTEGSTAEAQAKLSSSSVVFEDINGDTAGYRDPTLGDIYVYKAENGSTYLVRGNEPGILYSATAYDPSNDKALDVSEIVALKNGNQITTGYVDIAGTRYFYENGASGSTATFVSVNDTTGNPVVVNMTDKLLVLDQSGSNFIADLIGPSVKTREGKILYQHDNIVYIENSSDPWGEVDTENNVAVSGENDGQVISTENGDEVGNVTYVGRNQIYSINDTVYYDKKNQNAVIELTDDQAEALNITVTNGKIDTQKEIYLFVETDSSNLTEPTKILDTNGNEQEVWIVQDKTGQVFLKNTNGEYITPDYIQGYSGTGFSQTTVTSNNTSGYVVVNGQIISPTEGIIGGIVEVSGTQYVFIDDNNNNTTSVIEEVYTPNGYTFGKNDNARIIKLDNNERYLAIKENKEFKYYPITTSEENGLPNIQVDQTPIDRITNGTIPNTNTPLYQVLVDDSQGKYILKPYHELIKAEDTAIWNKVMGANENIDNNSELQSILIEAGVNLDNFKKLDTTKQKVILNEIRTEIIGNSTGANHITLDEFRAAKDPNKSSKDYLQNLLDAKLNQLDVTNPNGANIEANATVFFNDPNGDNDTSDSIRQIDQNNIETVLIAAGIDTEKMTPSQQNAVLKKIIQDSGKHTRAITSEEFALAIAKAGKTDPKEYLRSITKQIMESHSDATASDSKTNVNSTTDGDTLKVGTDGNVYIVDSDGNETKYRVIGGDRKEEVVSRDENPPKTTDNDTTSLLGEITTNTDVYLDFNTAEEVKIDDITLQVIHNNEVGYSYNSNLYGNSEDFPDSSTYCAPWALSNLFAQDKSMVNKFEEIISNNNKVTSEYLNNEISNGEGTFILFDIEDLVVNYVADALDGNKGLSNTMETVMNNSESTSFVISIVKGNAENIGHLFSLTRGSNGEFIMSEAVPENFHSTIGWYNQGGVNNIRFNNYDDFEKFMIKRYGARDKIILLYK